MTNVGRVLLAAVCAVSMTAQGSAQDVGWPSYGGDQGGTRYSTLTQINRQNVAQLQESWRLDVAAVAMQTQPIIIGRTLYAFSPDGQAIAVDAATGEKKWSFHLAQTPRAGGRGMTYWSEGAEHRLIVPANNLIYALDPDTGQPIAGFGNNGMIDIRVGLRDPDPARNPMRISSPPSLYRNIFIVNGGVPETSPSVPGDIRGFDVRTGELLWTFHVVPRPGEPGHETWPSDAWERAGGVNAWQGMVVDEDNGIVFAALGSPSDDFWGGERHGDNLYGNSVVALDAATGRKLWHQQVVRHDLWDADFAAPPTLMTVTRNGRSVQAVAATNKLGFVYLFDRMTGEPLFDLVDTPVPASDVPGEQAAVTQPVPVLPRPLARLDVTMDTLTNISPEANAFARERLAAMRVARVFTPLAYNQDTIAVPGFSGGAEWGGMSADPEGTLYINSNDIAWYSSVIEQPNPGPGKSPMHFSGYNKFRDAEGYPAVAPPWGTLNAIDMNTGEYRWRIPLGYYPALAERGLGDTGTENYGGPITTASGLLFIGATVFDRKFRAFDKDTGHLLWETELPYSGVATPATYMVDGRQYVVIATSGGRDPSQRGAAYVAFALPE
ncbi:MAG: pyrroloquinoline quinone-dependent dehydrogenase [Pseudomonadota bacterium]